jgi:hypothetical protein
MIALILLFLEPKSQFQRVLQELYCKIVMVNLNKGAINMKKIFISLAVLNSFIFGEIFSNSDLQKIFKTYSTTAFERLYYKEPFVFDGVLRNFFKGTEMLWFTTKSKEGLVTCPVKLSISKYDDIKVGDRIQLRGNIHLMENQSDYKKQFILHLFEGCTIHKR